MPVADKHAAARELLATSAKARMAADTLWAAGRNALATHQMLSSLKAALDAVKTLPSNDDETSGELAEQLEKLGLDRRDARQVSVAVNVERDGLPELDGDFTAVDAERHDQIQSAQRVLATVVARAADSRAQRRLWRLFRIAPGIAAVLTGVAIVAAAPLTYSTPFRVSASGYRSDALDAWPAVNATDRDEMTYWQLPAGESGWIDLRFDAPREISTVRILNGHDLHVDDRNRKDRRRFGYAAQNVRLHVWDATTKIAEVEATLPRLSDFDWTDVPLAASNASRLRIEIVDSYGNGGGIAEIEVR